jgi:hypothetical protein
MNTQTVAPLQRQLVDQPTNWPRLYFLPKTHYVQRQRAANSHQYNPIPQAAICEHRVINKNGSYLQRIINKLTAARNRAWLSLKAFGREVVHSLVKWFVLPMAIAACLSMMAANPAELPEDYFKAEEMAVTER